MNNLQFFKFVLLQIYTNKTKHISIFIISTLLITILSSFLFISQSISKDIKTTIQNQPDFVLQRILSGRVVDSPTSWVDEFISISGVTHAQGRVYGRYFYEPAETYFTIVGIDLYDEQILNNLKKVIKNIDIDLFLSKKNMIVGDGVKKFLNEYHFFDYYTFRPPDKGIEDTHLRCF